jgi:hypothetical protein
VPIGQGCDIRQRGPSQAGRPAAAAIGPRGAAAGGAAAAGAARRGHHNVIDKLLLLLLCGQHRILAERASVAKGAQGSANKISLGKYENSVCHVASTVAVKIDYR